MPTPAPTFAQIWTQLGYAVALAEAIEQFGNTTSPNVVTLYDTIQQGMDGEYTPAIVDAAARVRAGLSATLAPATLQSMFLPALREMGRVIGVPETDTVGLIRRIIEYMDDNSEYIKTRGMTLGTPTFPSGTTGNGAINRLTVGPYGEPLESVGPEVKSAECVSDQVSGAREHAEVFEFRGDARGRDELSYEGSGIVTRVPAIHCLSSNILRNPSFDSSNASSDNTAPSSTTAVTNWTIGSSASNFKMRSAAGYTYRGYPGEPATMYGLEFVGSDYIEQVFQAVNPGITFRPEVPYYAQVAWKRLASCTGTLTLTMGSDTVNVDVSSGTNGVWNILRFSLDKDRFYKNWKSQDAAFRITMGSLATGTVVVDDVVVAPMTLVDGTWYAPVGGSTPWLLGDTATITDTDGGSRGKFSYWMWRAFGYVAAFQGWFPTASGSSITLADPS